MSVLELGNVRDYLNVTDPALDGKILDTIAAAEAAIAIRVGPLEPTATTSRVFGGYEALILPVYPAISVTSVAASDESAVDVDDLQVDAGGVVRFTNPRTFRSPTYLVTYMAGREVCPGDLLLAAKEMVRYLWQANQRGTGGKPGTGASSEVSNTVPGAAQSLPFRIEQMLAPHISPRVA